MDIVSGIPEILKSMERFDLSMRERGEAVLAFSGIGAILFFPPMPCCIRDRGYL
jgi:hypothetical protein